VYAARRMKRLVVLMFLLGCDGSVEAPLPPPARHQIASGVLQLAGRGDGSCSQPPAGSRNDVWCAFTRREAGAENAEIWAVNITAAARDGATCDAPGPSCKLLTRKAWTRMPLSSGAYPSIDEFDGETLFIYENTDPPSGLPVDPYAGPISAWRPGWAEPRLVSTPRGYLCRSSPTAAVAYCLDSVMQVRRNTEFDLLAGALTPGGTAPLARVAHLSAHGTNGQLMWGVTFSPDGEHLAFSGPAPDGSAEVLQVIRTAEIGTGAAKPLVTGAAHWQLSADGAKVYYLADFNYDDRNGKPAGALTMIDFPGGANRRTLQPAVGDFIALGTPGQEDQGLAFLQDMAGGYGTMRLVRDRAHPDQGSTVATDVEDFQLSPDLRYSYLYRPAGQDGPESLVARTDGNGRCPINTRPAALPYLVTFLDSARMVLFAEDDADGVAQGWVTDPEGCQDKHHFVSNLAYLRTVRGGVLYGEQDPTGWNMTLRHAPIAAGGVFPDDGGALLEPSVGTHVAIAGRTIVFSIIAGDAAAQGLYLYGPLP
jgi:hypothetical protein